MKQIHTKKENWRYASQLLHLCINSWTNSQLIFVCVLLCELGQSSLIRTSFASFMSVNVASPPTAERRFTNRRLRWKIKDSTGTDGKETSANPGTRTECYWAPELLLHGAGPGCDPVQHSTITGTVWRPHKHSPLLPGWWLQWMRRPAQLRRWDKSSRVAADLSTTSMSFIPPPPPVFHTCLLAFSLVPQPY